jgi:hypothetical protein
MVRLYIPPLPQPTASTLVVVDFFSVEFTRLLKSTHQPADGQLTLSKSDQSHVKTTTHSSNRYTSDCNHFAHPADSTVSAPLAPLLTQPGQRYHQTLHSRPLVKVFGCLRVTLQPPPYLQCRRACCVAVRPRHAYHACTQSQSMSETFTCEVLEYAPRTACCDVTTCERPLRKPAMEVTCLLWQTW